MRDNKENKNDKRNNKIIEFIKRCLLPVAIALFLFLSFALISSVTENNITTVEYTKFEDMVEKGEVESIINYSQKSPTFVFISKDDTLYKTQNPSYDDFKKDMLQQGIRVQSTTYSSSDLLSVMSTVLMIAAMFFIFRHMGGLSDKDNMTTPINVKDLPTFNDVAGLKEVKGDLAIVIDFLKEPKKYKDSGAKLPRGLLFYGPPGTGKTLLAKAVAGEAGVPFYSISGSDFIEKYVGVGASRVRSLFASAKKNAPCIIFVDEIDAIGGRRNETRGTSEDVQTLDAFLTEMDGFSTDENIVIIAATNRKDSLDSALLRPGRFDSHFAVPLPVNSSEREEIINIYIKNKKLDDSVDISQLAKETLGFSPADIASIINEAALIAVAANNGVITKQILDEAFYKKMMNGHAKHDMERSENDIKLTAYHEAGHALIGYLTNNCPTKVTVIPSTSGAGGVTMFDIEKLGMYSRNELNAQIEMMYGGRVAEYIFNGGNEGLITTGAQNDLEKATALIRDMVAKYGMGDNDKYGLLTFNFDDDEIVEMAGKLSKKLYDDTLKLMVGHEAQLDVIANALIEKETITGNELKELLSSNDGE